MTDYVVRVRVPDRPTLRCVYCGRAFKPPPECWGLSMEVPGRDANAIEKAEITNAMQSMVDLGAELECGRCTGL